MQKTKYTPFVQTEKEREINGLINKDYFQTNYDIFQFRILNNFIFEKLEFLENLNISNLNITLN